MVKQFIVCLVFIAIQHAAAEFKSVPKWAYTPRDSLLQLETSNEPGQDIRYLLWDRQVNLLGELVHDYFEAIIEAKTPSSLSKVAKFKVKYYPSFEKLNIHYIRVYRNGKLVTTVKPKEIQYDVVESDIDKDLLYGTKLAFINLADIRVGDKVHYSYSIVGNNPALGVADQWSQYFEWGVPVNIQRFRVLTPKGSPLYSLETKGAPQAIKKALNGYVALEWTDKDIKPKLFEANVPYWVTDDAKVQVSAYNHWGPINQWAHRLYQVDSTLPNELMDSIAIWKGLPKEKALIKATRLVQTKIRYLGIEVGSNAYIPHNPKDTWNNRFGDCKDKTTLLNSILKALDITAYPALVNTYIDEGLDSLLPAPSSFDHVITYAVIDTAKYWIDATLSNQVGSYQQQSKLNLKRALIVDGQGDSLTAIIEPTKVKPDLIEIDSVVISDDNKVQIIIHSTFRYEKADQVRANYKNNSIESITNDYQQYYLDILGSSEPLTPIKFVDDTQNNVIVVKEHYNLRDYYSVKENHMEITMSGFLIWDYLQSKIDPQRIKPLSYYKPAHIIQKLFIDFDESEGFNWGTDTLQVLNSPQLDFISRQVKTSKTISSTWELKIKKEYVLQEELQQHIEVMKLLNEYSSFNVYLKSIPVTLEKGRYKRLWELLLEKKNVQ